LAGLLWPYSLWVESKIERFSIEYMKSLRIWLNDQCIEKIYLLFTLNLISKEKKLKMNIWIIDFYLTIWRGVKSVQSMLFLLFNLFHFIYIFKNLLYKTDKFQRVIFSRIWIKHLVSRLVDK
jgi:hypothetical protein